MALCAPFCFKSEASSSLQKVLWWNRAHGWCLFGGICFFHCRKSGRRAFCGGVSQVPRITIRQMKMNRFGTVQDRMGHRWQEQWESENESSDVLFSCSHLKLQRSYRIKIDQNPNQLSEDYNRHLEIVVILLVRPRICMFYVHIVHICTMFFNLLEDMAERLARVEQSLLEIHASMKDFMTASIETWTRNSSWGSEDCVWFCVLMDEVFHVIPAERMVLVYTLINGFGNK